MRASARRLQGLLQSTKAVQESLSDAFGLGGARTPPQPLPGVPCLPPLAAGLGLGGLAAIGRVDRRSDRLSRFFSTTWM